MMVRVGHHGTIRNIANSQQTPYSDTELLDRGTEVLPADKP